jgi:pilus assembly protein Flp/PilA
MTKFVTSVKNFLVSEDGPTAVEYAIMLALIVIVCIGAVQSIGQNARAKFDVAGQALTQ